jgi:hypothetical protein
VFARGKAAVGARLPGQERGGRSPGHHRLLDTEKLEEIPDRDMAGDLVPQSQFVVDRVDIVPAFPVPLNIALLFKIGDDSVNGPLRDIYRPGDLPGRAPGVLGDVDQNQTIVRNESPFRHLLAPPKRIRKRLTEKERGIEYM